HNNYMNSKWSNGATVHAGCNPLDNTKPIVTFMFPDDPNDSTGASESACGIPPSNRSGTGNVSGLSPNAGQRICVDIAFPITYDSTHLASVNALKSRIVNVQNFYNNNLTGCSALALSVSEKNHAEGTLKIYPNPASGILILELPDDVRDSSVEIFDIQGRKIFDANSVNSIQQINTLQWNTGLYIIIDHTAHQDISYMVLNYRDIFHNSI